MPIDNVNRALSEVNLSLAEYLPVMGKQDPGNGKLIAFAALGISHQRFPGDRYVVFRDQFIAVHRVFQTFPIVLVQNFRFFNALHLTLAMRAWPSPL